MSSDFELPPELLSQPLALVGLTGLNTESNSNHLNIWNSFNSAIRSERPPLNFTLLDSNHIFPPAKPDVMFMITTNKKNRSLINYLYYVYRELPMSGIYLKEFWRENGWASISRKYPVFWFCFMISSGMIHLGNLSMLTVQIDYIPSGIYAHMDIKNLTILWHTYSAELVLLDVVQSWCLFYFKIVPHYLRLKMHWQPTEQLLCARLVIFLPNPYL